VPEFEKRWNRWARRTNPSWRVDETYIRVRGKWQTLPRWPRKITLDGTEDHFTAG
jgi:transposase-like protein